MYTDFVLVYFFVFFLCLDVVEELHRVAFRFVCLLLF